VFAGETLPLYDIIRQEYPLVMLRLGVFIRTPGSRHGAGRNRDGTPPRYEYAVTVKSQASGLQGC
jgi:hypothetical protein